MKWYCSLLCHHPYAVVVAVTAVVTTCLVMSVTLRELPAFNDPSMGFEARGTAISNRAATWRAMLEATRPSGPLAVNPALQLRPPLPPAPGRHRGGKHTHMVCVEAVGGDISVQPNCTSQDLLDEQAHHSDHHHDTGADSSSGSVDTATGAGSGGDGTGSGSNSSIGVAAQGVGGTPTQRSSIDKLRLFGMEHDHRHRDDYKDYLIDHEPLHEYNYDDDYPDYDDYDDEDDYLNNTNHDHQHVTEDGFFCNALVPEYGHLVVSLEAAACQGQDAVATAPPPGNATHVAGGDRQPAQASLLTLQHLKSLCALDHRIRLAPSFSSICEKSSPTTCCPSWSIPNYVALLANRTDCSHITEEDVSHLRTLLHSCGRHFDLSLQKGCSGGQCSRLPLPCMKHDVVYTILHYLADVNFMADQQDRSGWSPLHTSALFLPVAQSSNTLPFYEELAAMSLSEGNVTVLSMELGVKNALFDKMLLQDAVLVMAAGVAVLILVYLYTTSVVITAVTIATVASSLVIAYFLYTFVFGITFFPYMNVLTVIIAIGLGADDTFVFCRVWRSVDAGKGDEGREAVVEEVMRHAASSVVVTSLTTAAAFLASTTSSITAIKCFSLFAGSVVLANLVLMLTWVPACLVIADRWRFCCTSRCFDTSSDQGPRSTGATTLHHNATFTRASNTHISSIGGATPVHSKNDSPSTIPFDNVTAAHRSPSNSMHNSSTDSPRSPRSPHLSHSISQSPPRSPHVPIHVTTSSDYQKPSNSFAKFCQQISETYSKLFSGLFERFLPWLITKPKVLWVVILLAIAVYAGILVFYYPGLRLPESADFQLFNRDHYFERYDLDHKYNFWFERNLRSDVINRLPIRIVWGFKPVDNGNHLNPASESTLEFDESFDLSAPRSQTWLLQFCRNLRKQDFYMSTLGPLLPNCFIETFKSWMEERRCADSSQNRYPCCEKTKFPYPRWVFNKCIAESVEVLYQTPRLYFVPGVAGPKFSKATGKVAALVIEYDSTAIWSLSFDRMHRFFTQVEEWSTKQLLEAPPGLRGGWFTSYLEFYEVQRSLLDGTTIAVAVAVMVSLLVLLLTTLNVVVSIAAVLSVAAVIVVTLAALVILGWRLNVLESIIVTAAIGLAVDLTLHYAVAYTKAPQGTRSATVTWAVTRLGSPVVMTTLTSLAAAIAMLPATVLAYIHIATFLIIISLTSFVYSTFFFLPLMCIIGPENNCGQIGPAVSCSQFCTCREDEHLDKSVYQQACLSESTLSTSSVGQSGAYTSGPNMQSYGTQYMSNHNLTHELEPLTSPGQTAASTTQTNSISGNSSICGIHNKLLPRSLRDNSAHSHRNSNSTQQGLGLIVSIQQCRQSKHQGQQNGSCAQLVVRKESTESQASSGGDVGCMCRSASVGSRPPSRTRGSKSSKYRRQHQSREKARKQLMTKQNSSPHITPANSVSTLVCSEPDTDLEAVVLAEQLRAKMLSREYQCKDPYQILHTIPDPYKNIGVNQQQQRQKQFVKQRNQEDLEQVCADTTASIV